MHRMDSQRAKSHELENALNPETLVCLCFLAFYGWEIILITSLKFEAIKSAFLLISGLLMFST